MKVRIEQRSLLELLEHVQGVINVNRTMPVLSNVFLQAKGDFLKVFGTDVEVSVTSKAKTNVLEEGCVVIDSKKLYLFIKELNSEELTLFKNKNNMLEITQKNARANIRGIDVKEYPYAKDIQHKEGLNIDTTVFKDMIEKTVFSISNDETRYHLNGILFQMDKTDSGHRYRMVSTDGHRLSLVERIVGDIDDEVIKEDNGVIIPKKGVNEIRKILDTKKSGMVSININDKNFVLKSNNTLLSIRLIDGTFPDYKQFVPQNFENKVKVSREKLISSLKVVSVLTDERSRSITFSIDGKKLEVSSNDSQLGDAREEIIVQHEGKIIKIGFNARYLLDVLNSIDEDSVNFEFKDEASPGVIRPEVDKDYTCVVMPMRIDRPNVQPNP